MIECPHGCGSDEIEIVPYKSEIMVQYRVRCKSCGALGPMSMTEKGAAKWWDTRAAETKGEK